MTPDTLHRLIRAIYTASGNETAWQHLLHDVRSAFHAAHSHFVLFDRPGHVSFDYITLPEAGQTYAAHYAARDIAMHRVMAGPDRQAVAEWDVLSEDELRACPMRQETMPAFGARHRLWVKSPLGGGPTYTTAIIRGTGQERFHRQDYKHLELLHDHLERALALHFELKRARAEANRLQAGMDTLATAVILADGQGTLLHANTSAHALLATADGLRLARGGLLAATGPRVAEKFQALLAHAAGCLGAAVAGSIALPRRQGRPLFVRAIPAPPSLRATQEAAAVVLLVRDPDQPLQVAAAALAGLGLTPAESRLTAALVAGLSLADYAAQTGLSPHSVRSLLKAALAKTGTHRQSELVLLALQAGGMV